MTEKKKILMVCLGNICRSPIAEAVMRDVIQKAGKDKEWHVDSAAIGAWHIDDLPDHRAMSVMEKHGIIYSNCARQIKKVDFQEFDYIFGMDEDNMSSLKRLAPKGCGARLLMLGDFGLKKEERIIEDPYYLVGEAPFERVFDQCEIACRAFFKDAVVGRV